MTECEEVAANLPPLRKGATMDDARRHVRSYMPNETDVVVDNVAEAMLALARGVVRDPNNVRNRWRRYRAAWRAYNWAGALSFREWATGWGRDPKAYAAKFEEPFLYLLGKERR